MSIGKLTPYILLTILISFIVFKQFNTNEESFEVFKNPYKNSENVVKSKINKDNSELQKPWFRNSIHGFSFETPEKLEHRELKVPEGYESMVNKIDAYVYQKDQLTVTFTFMDSNFEDYDTEVGLKGAIQNVVYDQEGKNLKLTFSKPSGQFDDLMAKGTFIWKDLDITVSGYAYWNKKGKIALLICTARNTLEYQKTIDMVINSRRIAF